MEFERPSWTPFLATCGVFLALVGVAGWQSWINRTQEFHGKLASNVRMGTIPEDPCAIADLITPGGNYELVFPSERSWLTRPKLIDELTRMDGKNVIVRGKLVTWRYPFMRSPRSRLHEGIQVYEIRLSSE